MPMTGFQRFIVTAGAVLLAFRLFFPAKYVGTYGLRTDFYTTLLQVMGILVVTAALFILCPTMNLRGLWNRLDRGVKWVLVGLLGVATAYMYVAVEPRYEYLNKHTRIDRLTGAVQALECVATARIDPGPTEPYRIECVRYRWR